MPRLGKGNKYGSSLRKRWAEVMLNVRSKYECPSCGAWRVKRVAIGIWACRRCGYKFAGQAYVPAAEKR